jgi:hypothetical protein
MNLPPLELSRHDKSNGGKIIQIQSLDLDEIFAISHYYKFVNNYRIIELITVS